MFRCPRGGLLLRPSFRDEPPILVVPESLLQNLSLPSSLSRAARHRRSLVWKRDNSQWSDLTLNSLSPLNIYASSKICPGSLTISWSPDSCSRHVSHGGATRPCRQRTAWPPSLSRPLTGAHRPRQTTRPRRRGGLPGGLWGRLGIGHLTSTASFGGPHGTSRRDRGQFDRDRPPISC